MKSSTVLLILGLLTSGSTGVFAQATPSSGNCTPTQATPQQGTLAPNGTAAGSTSEPLSEKLAKSDGVLCPPSGVDTEMHVPAPNVGTMPVIPPPSSPGGDQTVRPK